MSRKNAGIAAVVSDAEQQAETVVLVDIEQMHRSDVMTLQRRVTAANTRITAEVEELRATQYGNFEPEVTLARYSALERAIAEGKKLLMRVACVAVTLFVLSGCCDATTVARDSKVDGHCANGQCDAR